ncbi:type I polyketide synthase [Amycolatopsis alba DSM 44262]|uniref:Type I polyketide synthase n=2 Tax=Amycolatopsis alba TaxID=76020 RepID=A0A229RL03_AMYAL|nr:type I polyketide synthase [Amycolatopsis alba DSM 44262]
MKRNLDEPGEQASLADLFAAQVAQRPDEVAIELGTRHLSYAEVDARAGRLAERLTSHGVGPEDIVAVALPRSLELVVSVLAISKAGAAFLSIDLRLPFRRIEAMLTDASATMLIADEDNFPVRPKCPVITPESILAEPSAADVQQEAPGVRRSVAIDIGSVAYVFYTSGSTGRPKGVAVTHAGLAGVARTVRRQLGVEPGRRVLQYASPSFDVFVLELMALVLGATLVVADTDDLQPGPALARTLRDRRISNVVLPPAVLALLEGYEVPSPELTVVLAGEAWSGELVREWSHRVRIVNGYGLTETTIATTLSDVFSGAGDPPLGPPVDGARMYLLDSALAPVNPDTVGELYIAGPVVARGYLGQPAMTAERFVACPFGSPGERMYRTGDLVRRGEDDDLFYVGRADSQVELHGVRIELSEIEATLGAHPAVKLCAAMVRENSAGIQRLVAYVVEAGDEHLQVAELRSYLQERLPRAMLPSLYVPVPEIPLTPLGYMDRSALPVPADLGTPAERERESNEVKEQREPVTVETLQSLWAEVLDTSPIDIDVPFFELGGTSLIALRLHKLLADRHGVELDVTALFEHPTLRQFAEHIGTIESPKPTDAQDDDPNGSDTTGIAIVGMAGRFPGAADVGELWEMLEQCQEGLEHSTDTSGTTAEQSGVREVGTHGWPPGAGEFDAALFGFTSADAREFDPQQGLFLETVWEALENAGYAPNSITASVGVFGGTGVPYHWLDVIRATEGDGAARQRAEFANPMQMLCAHTAHRLGLRGPAVTINTTCSTSLVAVHMACRSLLAGDCEMALAGGVSLPAPGTKSYTYEEGGALSPDGHCRPFDSDSQGTVPAAGAGVVVLKRLHNALADGDMIHAVISGSAVNNDGSRKAGFTAPSVEGQIEVIEAAHRAARVNPGSIEYVQAHGTATALGDAIEVRALTRVFGDSGPRKTKCVLGSVKSNLGHLDVASGVTGLITAVLALRHRRIPGVVHFRHPNPHLELDQSPFEVNSRTIDWPESDGPRRAGISSFGLGGTNAHLVVEEAPRPRRDTPARRARTQVLPVSARESSALDRTCARLAEHLSTQADDTALADVAFTLQRGRAVFDHRRAAVCKTRQDASELLTTPGHQDVFTAQVRTGKVAFLFPGGGSQHPFMGRELYESEAAFRHAFDASAELFDAELDCDLRALTFSSTDSASEALLRPSLNLSSIAATEVALTALLRSWGIAPAALLGHSLGECVAAHVAGILTLPEMVGLIALRGRLIDELPPAASLVVGLGEDELRSRLGEKLSLACVNSAKNCVVSGPVDDVSRLEEKLRQDDVNVRRLAVAAGAHSATMLPALGKLEEYGATLAHRRPKIPMISGLTGSWLDPAEAPDPGYWARHLRNTARLADSLTTLLKDPELTLVHVGPGKSLVQSAELHPDYGDERLAIAPLLADTSESHQMACLAARLWCHGVRIDWNAVHHDPPHKVALPGTVFTRTAQQPPDLRRDNVTSTSVDRRQAPTAEPLAELWCELLGVDDVDPADDFFRSGGDSHLAIVFRRRIQEQLGTQLSTHTLLEHSTFGALAESIKAAEPTSPLMTTLRTGPATRTSLYLLPPLGGTVFSYRELVNCLQQSRTVQGFRAHGLEPGESIPSTIEDIAERNVTELLDADPRGPYVLGGHSAGGLIAQEMARQLFDRGHEVSLIVMIDTPSPEERHGLPDPADVLSVFDGYRSAAPRAWQAMRSAMDHDPRAREVMAATVEAIRHHQPSAIPVDLLYLRANDEIDGEVKSHETAWKHFCTGDVAVHTVPGNHLTVVEEPHVREVAEIIEYSLADTDSSSGPREPRAEGAARPEIGLRTPSGLLVNGLTLVQTAELITMVGGITTDPAVPGGTDDAGGAVR